MSPLELVAAGIALLLTLAVGSVVHEVCHAAVLTAVGIPFRVVWLPNSRSRAFDALASVSPQPGTDPSPWGLRLAAIMPIWMVAPVGLALLGIVPDPVSAGDTIGTAILVGWLACALPSPQDFSVCFYAHRAIQAESLDQGSKSNRG